MKRKYGVMLAAAVITVFVGAGIVSAMSGTDKNYKAQSVTIASSETYNGALYVTGQSLTVAGTVKGDIYCASQTVIITGTVEGDVLCASQNIQINGKVTGNVRVAAQAASFGGTVGGTITAFSQTVDVGNSAVIGGDLNGAAGTMTVAGKVGRDILASAGSMTITGIVGRDIGGNYNQLAVLDNSSVGGALRYTSDQDANIAKGSVLGEVIRTAPQTQDATSIRNSLFGFGVYVFFSMILIALVVALIAPRLVNTVANNGISRLLASLLVGFFFVFGAPFILLFIAMTVVGIPLVGLLFLSWLVVLILSGPVFGYYVGRLIMQRHTTNPLLVMLVGSTVVLLSYFIPILNIFTLLATSTVGTGMIVLTLAKYYQKPVYKLEK